MPGDDGAVAHFVADVHLRDGEPGTWDDFFAYLDGPARGCCDLYLLGDIFHAWIGDDDRRELARMARERLAGLVRSGTRVHFVFGNHDFLVGRRFARKTGVRLLGESAVVDIGQTRLLLMHGDTLCTADTEYLRARARILRPHYLLYARLLTRRMRIARAKRMLAGTDGSGFLAKSVEVDEALAERLMSECGAQVLIHGHVHAGGCHGMAGSRSRWALPAWPGGRGPGGWLAFGERTGALRQGGWADRG